ncbi:hypothetical protein MM213_13235 [Belliella sp. R4-6]|uniref:Uncharacterized protein n=1 Tax=Belliella alkalica TaxID=1730871 RepID=A0ABS9VDE7_9BACT|nr:hypothetical protein [Belliella alkalica]MCH7414456.1 hypothetical protein [Belliella alkalica]
MKYYFLVIMIIFAISSQSCIDDSNPIETGYNWSTHEPFKAVYNTFSMPFSEKWNPLPEIKGTVALREASGLAYSYKNPGKLWSHQDSGNTNMLFLIDAETGEIITRYRIEGTVNIDWEDIEISYGPEEGETYLYIGDTGDNQERRGSYTIYRFKEPEYQESHSGQTVTLSNLEIDKIDFRFPDGSHDTEGLLVDPITLDIFLATKRDVFSFLYVLPYPQKTEAVDVAFKAGEFGFRETSAATSNLAGDKVLIKNRQEIFYWEKEEDESMVQMLSRTPIKAPYAGEPQGEAICFDPDGNYFTLSEELNSTTKPNLYKYLKIN